MKKLMVIVMGLLLVGIVNVYAGGYGVEDVKDNNDGNKGDILIHTGTFQGGNDIGHWTDIADVPELKGEKGDKGDTGQQGIQGNNGDKGDTGENGKDVDPTLVTNLQNTDITLQNNVDTEVVNRKNENNTLNNRINDTNNRVDNLDHRVGKLEQTQVKAQFEFRILDTKRVTISPYISQNFTRSKVDEVGVRVTVKIGKSYEEKLIEKQNARLKSIEKKLDIPQEVLEREIVKDKKGNIISEHISISESGWKVDTKF